MRNIPAWSLALASMILVAPQPAAAQTSVVFDPVGDASFSEGITGQPFQDIVRAEVSKNDEGFRFVMEVAAPIPANPPLSPPGVNLLEWSFRLDTNPTTNPAGFPFVPGMPRRAEFMVFVLWDGATFTAFVIDRRPLLTGGNAVIIPVPFDIEGAEITVSVGPASIGDPPNFQWAAVTEEWPSPLGTFAFFSLDIAPDSGFTSWPPQ